MFRNQYDSDVSVWSPQGRIYQIEYAMEAVKQGSATVGIKSKTHVVLVALKRAPSELSAHQKKITPIDDHIGISIAGLTADARILSRFMRNECLNHKYAHELPMPVSRLVFEIGNKSQIPTQRYGRRPFGVGLLVGGYDELGTHLYQTCPSANFYECKAMAIGARSQSARTYLEKHLSLFHDCSLDELIKHALRALRDTLPAEIELTTKNCSLGIVGKDVAFSIFDDEKIKPYVDAIEGDARAPAREEHDIDVDLEIPQPGTRQIPEPRTNVNIEAMEHDQSELMAVRVIQVTNVSTNIQKEQVRSLFALIGRIDELQLYPESETLRTGVGASVAYIKFDTAETTQAALQLNNTMFIDKTIICNPVKSGKIPHETEAVKYCAPLSSDISLMPGGSSWPSTVVNRVHGVGADAYVETLDPALTERGLLPYPSLPASLEQAKIEEIRRTVYVSNIATHVSLDNLNDLFDQVGEVRFIRFAGQENSSPKSAYIEFSEQHHVVRALCLNGLKFAGNTLKVSHATNTILKPPPSLQITFEPKKKEEVRVKSPSVTKSVKKRSASRSRKRSRTRSKKRSKSPRSSTKKSSVKKRSKSRSKDRKRTRSPRDTTKKKRSSSRDTKKEAKSSRKRSSSRSKATSSKSSKRRSSKSPPSDKHHSKHKHDRKKSKSRDREMSKKRDKDKSKDKKQHLVDESNIKDEKSNGKEKVNVEASSFGPQPPPSNTREANSNENKKQQQQQDSDSPSSEDSSDSSSSDSE